VCAVEGSRDVFRLSVLVLCRIDAIAGFPVAVGFIAYFPAGSKYYWYVLTGGTDGTFSGKVYVNKTGPATASGGPLNYANLKPYSAPLTGTIKVDVPPFSVIYLVADKK